MNNDEIRFPKELEKHPQFLEIKTALFRNTTKLWDDGELEVPELDITVAMRTGLFYACASNQATRGFETISTELDREKNGLKNLTHKTGQPMGTRLTRLLIVSNDGAKRFYRNIEDLALKHEPRLLVCRLKVDSEKLGNILYGKPVNVKAILINHKKSVTSVLESLISQS